MKEWLYFVIFVLIIMAAVAVIGIVTDQMAVKQIVVVEAEPRRAYINRYKRAGVDGYEYVLIEETVLDFVTSGEWTR